MTQIIPWEDRSLELSVTGILQMEGKINQIGIVCQSGTTVGVYANMDIASEDREWEWGATSFIRDTLEAINTYWATVGCICQRTMNLSHFLPNEDGVWCFTLPGTTHYGFDISEAHPCHMKRRLEGNARLKEAFDAFKRKCIIQYHNSLPPSVTVQPDE